MTGIPYVGCSVRERVQLVFGSKAWKTTCTCCTWNRLQRIHCSDDLVILFGGDCHDVLWAEKDKKKMILKQCKLLSVFIPSFRNKPTKKERRVKMGVTVTTYSTNATQTYHDVCTVHSSVPLGGMTVQNPTTGGSKEFAFNLDTTGQKNLKLQVYSPDTSYAPNIFSTAVPWKEEKDFVVHWLKFQQNHQKVSFSFSSVLGLALVKYLQVQHRRRAQ